MKFYLIFTIFIFFIPMKSFAVDNKKYCDFGNNSTKIYLLQRKIKDEESKAEFINLFQEKFQALAPGDRLTLSTFSGSGKNDAIDGCLPECPKVGFFQGLTSSCLAPQADRDKKNWASKIKKQLRNILRKESNGNIFKELNNIQLDIEKSSDYDEHYIVGSMIPDNMDGFSKDEFDRSFVKAIQSNLLSEDLPDMDYCAVKNNSELMSFWEDIYSIKDQSFNVGC